MTTFDDTWADWELEQRRDAVLGLLETYLLDMSAYGKRKYAQYSREYDSITSELTKRISFSQLSLFDPY